MISENTVEHRYLITEGLIERMDVFDHWTIRNAIEEDIQAVLELWAAADSPPSVTDSLDGLTRLLAADPQALLVAEHDGVLTGSLVAAWDGWRGSFYRLAVSPEHRRKGLATMLLREGERRLREPMRSAISSLREPSRPVEIAKDTLGDGPLAGRHACIMALSRNQPDSALSATLTGV